MPNFAVHTGVNLLVLTGLVVASYKLGMDDVQTLGLAGGMVLATFVLSPDLDLYTSRIARNWGPLRFLAFPYSKIFNHGGVGHWPLVGTALRYGYLAAIVGLVWLGLTVLGVWADLSEYADWFKFLFIGSVIADSIHEGLDILITHHKEPKRWTRKNTRS